ncbi:MAG TPA: hypothetical protein VFK41_13200 [Nocardioidaceae bacterium]|nr:hypothetical protein [Nocardioidaceae bacterium]
MRRALVLTTAGAVLVGLSALPAVADGWVPLPAAVIADGNKSRTALDVAASSNGDAVAVWAEATDTGSAVMASVRHDGLWSEPEVIEDGGGSSTYPRVVVDADGFATVVWSRYVTSPSSDKSISFATRPAGGSWSSAAEIVPAQQGEVLRLAMTPDGSVSAAWQYPTGGAIVADKAPGGTSWTTTVLGGAGGPVLAAAADNRMAVSWNEGSNVEQLAVKVRAAGGTWADATKEAGSIADPDTTWPDIPAEPVLGFGDDGALHVAYHEYEDPTQQGFDTRERIRYSTRSAEGTWSYHPDPISASDFTTRLAGIAGDSEGNVTVLWNSLAYPSFDGRIWAATRVSGTWEEPFALTGPNGVQGLSFPEMVSHDGLATVLWTQDSAAKANRRTAAGDWLAEPESIASSTIMTVQAALEASGEPLAVWVRFFYDFNESEFHYVLETRTYDSSAPPTDVTGPVTTMTQPVKPFYLATYLPLAWTAQDESEVATSRYRFRAAPWNGGYPTQYENLSTFAPGSSALYLATPGKTFCFQAQSRDVLDNEGAWSGDLCTATPVDDRTATRKGRWGAVKADQYYRGTAMRSKDRGATMTLEAAQGKRVGLVVTKCKGCGKISVRFAGQLLGTWSLHAKKTRNQVYLPVKLFDSVRTGRLVVKVVSPEGTPVIVDGLLVGRR